MVVISCGLTTTDSVMQYEVNEEAPPPELGGSKYPFKVMGVGSGFNIATRQDRDRAQSAACAYVRTEHGKGKRFKSAKYKDGYRLWRWM